MQTLAEHWDYLIITASNEKQASAYESQLYLRRKLGFIPGVKQILVLSDPGGNESAVAAAQFIASFFFLSMSFYEYIISK